MSSLAGAQRLFSRSHELLTRPINGISQLGMSDWAKRNLVWFTFARLEYNPKTLFSYYNKERIDEFLLNVEEEKALSAHQKFFRNKFCIRRGEAVTLFETYEYDVEFCAPVDLRIVDINMDIWMDFRRLPDY